VRQLITEATARLQDAGVLSPVHDAEALAAHVLDVPRLLVRSASMTEQQVREYQELVARRANRVPLQHLVGRVAFRRVELSVGPGVFVPRPETEVVVGEALRALEQAREASSQPIVADLCTGSGAIAAALADEAPWAQVHAVELDDDALVWATRNLAGSGVDLRHGDMAHELSDLDGRVDVVVSNPPYIPLEAWESVSVEGRDHDPPLALWAGDDGLDLLRVLERTAHRLLRPGGAVVAEHADEQGESAPAVFSSTGRWVEVRDHRDLARRNRFVTARKPR
jgi:release factor glutamine methyltransferase